MKNFNQILAENLDYIDMMLILQAITQLGSQKKEITKLWVILFLKLQAKQND